MATVLIPHSWNQSAKQWRSSVKVPNVRTGSEARSGQTAETCIFAPTSMAAARGWTGDIAREWTGLFFPVMPASPCVGKQREELDCAGYQFPNRDHREASPLSSAQQSMDHVFLRDHPPPKICRPLPSTVRFYRGTVSLATGGPQAGEGFFEGNARARPVPSHPRSRPDPVEGAARALRHELGSNSGSTALKHRVAWRWHSSTGPKYITIQRFLSSTAARRAAA